MTTWSDKDESLGILWSTPHKALLVFDRKNSIHLLRNGKKTDSYPLGFLSQAAATSTFEKEPLLWLASYPGRIDRYQQRAVTSYLRLSESTSWLATMSEGSLLQAVGQDLYASQPYRLRCDDLSGKEESIPDRAYPVGGCGCQTSTSTLWEYAGLWLLFWSGLLIAWYRRRRHITSA